MPSLAFPPDFRISKFKSTNVSVGVTAAQVDTAANISGLESFVWITLYNNHATQIVYLGADNTVTTANGFPLQPGETQIIPATDAPSFDLWAIADGAATDLRVMFSK
jgi:hypothetical protein